MCALVIRTIGQSCRAVQGSGLYGHEDPDTHDGDGQGGPFQDGLQAAVAHGSFLVHEKRVRGPVAGPRRNPVGIIAMNINESDLYLQ